jgi:hypothetical protein
MKFWVILLGVLIILDGAFSFLLGENLSIPDMLLFLDSLLVVSAIVFGIIGAWLAIIWQNASSSSQEQHENISYLKNTVLCSFAVIAFSLAIKFLYPFIKDIALELLNDIAKIWLKRIFVFISGIFGLILMIALFLSLMSFDFFSFNADSEKQQKEDEEEYRKRQMSQTTNIRKVK